MRGDFINQKLTNLLSRLSPPRAIAKDARAQAEEMKLLAKAINSAMPSRESDEWWLKFEEALLSSLQTRAWPTLREVKQSCSDIRSGRSDISDELAESNVLNIAIEWFNSHGKPHPVLNSPQITNQMVDQGMLPTLRYARWKGFDLTTEQQREAIKQRSCMEEWRCHCTIMARLNNVTYAEAEARERAEVSPTELPLELTAHAAE